jgi:hypothetical protein
MRVGVRLRVSGGEEVEGKAVSLSELVRYEDCALPRVENSGGSIIIGVSV